MPDTDLQLEPQTAPEPDGDKVTETPEHPWERRPGETLKAYQAFQHFLTAQPRSIANAWRNGGEGSNPRVWEGWSVRYQWQHRARQYDDHLARVDIEAKESAIRQNAKRWADRRDILLEAEWQTGVAMLNRARAMVRPLPGSTPQNPIFPEVPLSNAAALADVGAKLARRAAKMPAEIEAAPPADWDAVLFKSPGKMAASLPAEAVPEMPADVLTVPRVGLMPSQDGVMFAGRPVSQPSAPPRPN